MIRYLVTGIMISVLVLGTVNAEMTQKDKQKDKVKLENIMILFVGKNYENRKLLESELTYYINDRGFQAAPSFRYLTEASIPHEETVIETLEENDFDGILVVQVVNLDVKEKWVNAKMKYGNTPATPFFFSYYDLSRQYSVGYSTQEISYELESTLFKTSDKSMVYTTTSKTYDRESLDMAMESYAKTTAQQLKNSKTLLKTK